MATTPQGNFAAYKELKYRAEDRDQTVDFISLGIDRLIKEGKARDAATLKQAQDLGKTYYEAVKDIKIEPIQTTAMFQEFDNKAFNETFDAVAEAKRITQDPSVSNSLKQQYSQKALEKQKSYMELKTFLGDKDQLKLFTDKLNTDTSKIWRGDEGLKIMRAVKANAITYGFDNSGKATVKFLDPDTNEVVEKDFNSATQAVLNPYSEELVNKKDGLYDQMRQEATNMFSESENGIGGNRTTKSTKFNPDDAKKSFDIRFGDYNLNNDDAYLKQFSYDVLNNRTIKNKEDWTKVRQAYVDKMGTFVKSESSTVDKYNATQLEGQRLENMQRRKDIAKSDVSAGEKEDKALGNGTLSVGNVVLNIKGSKGGVNHYETKGLSYFVNGNTNEGKASKIGITTYWNPNGGSEGKGGFSYGMNIPSNDGKKVVIEGVDAERAKQILASNKVKDPQNTLAMMATLASQNGISGIEPKGVGRNFSNYKVNFSPVKAAVKNTNNSSNSGPTTFPKIPDYTKIKK